MYFTIQRELLLKPLQLVSGIIERRQVIPILSNVLIRIEDATLYLVGSNLETELISFSSVSDYPNQPGKITVPARKLIDICKSLPSKSLIHIKFDEKQLLVVSGNSKFKLSILSADGFPGSLKKKALLECSLQKEDLRELVERTSFAMGQQDVRHYLNATLFDFSQRKLCGVTTDGHRLAIFSIAIQDTDSVDNLQIIIPRRGVLTLVRLLTSQNETLNLVLTEDYIRIVSKEFIFTTKLVEGTFPDYKAVLPKDINRSILTESTPLLEALNRVSILSHEKQRGVKLVLSNNQLKILANNYTQEEAEESILIKYNGGPLEIGFNVSYLLEALSTMKNKSISLGLSASNNSALIQEIDSNSAICIVMPMRL